MSDEPEPSSIERSIGPRMQVGAVHCSGFAPGSWCCFIADAQARVSTSSQAAEKSGSLPFDRAKVKGGASPNTSALKMLYLGSASAPNDAQTAGKAALSATHRSSSFLLRR